MSLIEDPDPIGPRAVPAATRASLAAGLVICVVLSFLLGKVTGDPLPFAAASLAAFVIIAAVIWLTIDRTGSMPEFGLPNQVTLFRSLMVCQLVGLIVLLGRGLQPDSVLFHLFAGLSLLAFLLDGLDGYLARRFGPVTAFGARFDMEIDAFLILLLALIATIEAKAGAWIILAGALRYVFVVAGWLLPWLDAPLFPSFRRKLICVIQIAGLWLLLLPEVTAGVGNWIAAGTLILLVWSFAVDSFWLYARREQNA